MESLDELLQQAKVAHGHLCAGQILGVRMALLGLSRLGIGDPRGADRKRLITYVEIDRCATDAIALVTGCRLGKRALKFRDWGKMAATFVDLALAAPFAWLRSKTPRELAAQLYPNLESKSAQQMAAYRELPDSQLFREQWVRVDIDPADLPGASERAHRVRALRRGRELRPVLSGGWRVALPRLRAAGTSILEPSALEE